MQALAVEFAGATTAPTLSSGESKSVVRVTRDPFFRPRSGRPQLDSGCKVYFGSLHQAACAPSVRPPITQEKAVSAPLPVMTTGHPVGLGKKPASRATRPG